MSNEKPPTSDTPAKAEARKAEADGTSTAQVEFRGHTFTISRDYDEMSVDFIESIEEGKTVGIVRGALGAAQWRRVQAMNLRMKELAPLAEDIAAAMGFNGTGESPASSD